MIHSIQQFQEKGVKNLENIFVRYSGDMTKMAEMIMGVKEEVLKLGISMIVEELEKYDEYLRMHKEVRPDWQIVRRDETSLITSMGTMTYKKTLFKNKFTKKSCYLLDRVMGIEKHTRLTEDAEAALLEEAVQTSYRRGGDAVSVTKEFVSKEAVKDRIHELSFPKAGKVDKKKVVDYLYLDADEDHVSLQFREKKGDIVKGKNNRKNNNAITKLVYVYEGIEKEAPKSKRNKLVNPYYFCRVCEGKGNQEFWDEIYEYLDRHYDLEKVKKIYLNADGGAWIKAGKRRIAGITYILDEFHLEKYIMKMIGHMKDSRGDAKKEIYEAIKNGTKEDFKRVTERLRDCLDEGMDDEKISEGETYILSNWNAAKIRVSRKKGMVGCSAEGHVSHVLSSRMSSRPMGWSITGMSKMAELRAYYYNGGNMLDLVRHQRAKTKMVAGAEELEITSAAKIMAAERANKRQLGVLADIPVYTIPYPQIKKIANFKNHIYGL